jgi:hypothetical protein
MVQCVSSCAGRQSLPSPPCPSCQPRPDRGERHDAPPGLAKGDGIDLGGGCVGLLRDIRGGQIFKKLNARQYHSGERGVI